MVKAILFDLDGTLIDSNTAILESFQRAFQKVGLPYPGNVEVASYFGKSLEAIIIEMKLPTNMQEEFRTTFQQAILNSKEIHVFEGIIELLTTLSDANIKMAVVTSKSREGALKAIETLSLSKYFEIITTADDTLRHKPDPTPLLHTCAHLGVKPSQEEAWYIGDTLHDMEAAIEGNLRAIGVTWGTLGQNMHNLSLVTVLEHPNELLTLLEQ